MIQDAKAAYQAQLKRCGFRSWKSANRRRGELIDKRIDDGFLTASEVCAYVRLQKLAELYLDWKSPLPMPDLIQRLRDAGLGAWDDVEDVEALLREMRE